MMGEKVVKKIRVLVVDDQPLIRKALELVFGSVEDIELVGEADNGAEAVEKVCQLRPDVVLLDLRMPKMGGLEALRKIKEEVPRTKVVVLSILDGKKYVREAFNLGASGYTVKDIWDRDLTRVIRGVTSGQIYVHPSIKHLVSERLKEASGRKL